MQKFVSIYSKLLKIFFQVGQDIDEKWPLTVINHKGKKNKIFLKPGEMLLYESAKVPHGRQFPLQGKFYDNIFVHFRPKMIPFNTDDYIKYMHPLLL